MASVEKRIQEEILRELDMTREISDEELLGIIRQKICDVGKEEYLSIAYRMELEHRIFYGLRRLDVLEDLLADDGKRTGSDLYRKKWLSGGDQVSFFLQ